MLDRREKEARELRPARVLGRNEDGTLKYAPLASLCSERGGAESYLQGQVVPVPSRQPQSSGAAGLPLLFANGSITLFWVERLVPNVFQAGQSQTIEVHGIGLSETMAFEFLLADGKTINDGITVDEVRFVSTQLLELDLTVAPGAQEITEAELAYGTG